MWYGILVWFQALYNASIAPNIPRAARPRQSMPRRATLPAFVFEVELGVTPEFGVVALPVPLITLVVMVVGLPVDCEPDEAVPVELEKSALDIPDTEVFELDVVVIDVPVVLEEEWETDVVPEALEPLDVEEDGSVVAEVCQRLQSRSQI